MQEIESNALSESGLQLFLRTSGFNEKEHFYELYKGKPAVDECGMPAFQALSQAHIDSSNGTPVIVSITYEQIEIEYAADNTDVQLNDVIVILK